MFESSALFSDGRHIAQPYREKVCSFVKIMKVIDRSFDISELRDAIL
jgi:hypothetical protein